MYNKEIKMSDEVKKPKSVVLSERLAQLENDVDGAVNELNAHLSKIIISDEDKAKIKEYDKELKELNSKKNQLQAAIDKLEPIINLKKGAREGVIWVLTDKFDVSEEDILNRLGN